MGDILVSGGTVGFNRDVTAYGTGELNISDRNSYTEEFFSREPNSVRFKIYNGITGVESGFFSTFTTLHELEVPESVKYMDESPETVALMKQNCVLIRGVYDSAAERFAEKHGLSFAHSDVEIARVDVPGREYDFMIITLRLPLDRGAYIHQDYRCPGISAGSTGGGETDVPLPKNYVTDLSPKDIADLCWGACYSAICSSKTLKQYLAGAKKRKK